MERATGDERGRDGVDQPPERRPGVPMRAAPRIAAGARPGKPQPQPAPGRHLRRKGLPELTPVYGTAQLPRGVSGMMRRAAYEIPEHSAAHWALLLAADRVDVVEDRLAHGFGPDTLDAMGRRIRTNPLPALMFGLLIGIAVRRAMR